MQKKTFAAFVAALAFTVGAHAAEGKKQFSEKQLAQQQVMRDCNATAKADGLKGADRKAFMKTCLSGGKSKAAADTTAMADDADMAADTGSKKTTQKAKMKACNADAKEQGLKGAERKTFMSECLAAD